MNNRIKEIRIDHGFTQSDFADRISITRSALCKIESGINNPSDQTLQLICKLFHVNMKWIRTGYGAKYYDITEEEEIAEFFGELQSDDPQFAFKKRLITALAHMDDSGWDAIEKLIMEATKKDHD